MDVVDALEAIVRRERTRVVAALVRSLRSIEAAEEAFQDATVAALDTWPTRGVPANPAGWLLTTARNAARDAFRHQRIVGEHARIAEEDMGIATLDTELDDQLRLLFACCHPALAREAQVALALKVLLGFSVEDIARAFLCPETTMAQRIVRAKRTVDEKRLAYETPEPETLHERLSGVLAVVYFVFNEGYTSRSGPLMRLDLQREALRLGRLLTALQPQQPEVFGLYALLCLSTARARTRVDRDGVLLLLSEQDRSQWDRALLIEGLVALSHAVSLGGDGDYALQAELASCHAVAPTWERTDWPRILRVYDALFARHASPVIALNRAVAVGMCEGPAAALAQLAPLESQLERYHLFYATRADFRRRLADPGARDDYARALELADNDGERAFLQRRLAQLT